MSGSKGHSRERWSLFGGPGRTSESLRMFGGIAERDKSFVFLVLNFKLIFKTIKYHPRVERKVNFAIVREQNH